MKITKLYLKNFSRIKSALGVDEVTLDFKKSENLFTFFQGGNGSGKSSLLNQLHPWRDSFDGVGSLTYDDAVKEIWIEHENGDYRIRHEWSRVAKTFVYRGEELLNPNGNVREAEKLINSELGYTSEFLELSRISSSMSSFLDKKSTERKNFITSLMPSIEFYIKSHDKVKAKISEENRKLRSIQGELDKLESFNEEELVNTQGIIERLKADSLDTSNRLAVINSQITTNKNEIDQLEFVAESVINEINLTIDEMGKGLGEFVGVYGKKSTELARTELDVIKEQNVTNNIERTSLITKLKEVNESIGKLKNTIAEDEEFISKLNAVDFKKIESDINEFESIIKSINKEDKFYKLVTEKKVLINELPNLENFVSYVTNQKSLLGKHYKDLDSIGIINIQNLETTEKAKLTPILTEIKELETIITKDELRYNEFTDSQKGESKHCDNPTCPYEMEIAQYEKLGAKVIDDKRKLNELNKKLEVLQEEISEVTMLKNKADEYIILRRRYSQSVTFEEFMKQYNMYTSDNLIYDFRQFVSNINKAAEDIALLSNTMKSLESSKKELEGSKDKISLLEKMNKEIEEDKVKLKELTDSLIVIDYDIKETSKKQEEFSKTIALYEKFILAKDNLKKLLEEKASKEKQKKQWDELREIGDNLNKSSKTLSESKSAIDKDISHNDNRIKQLERLKLNKEILDGQISESNSRLEILDPINDVLDPKKGIPVVFQRVYLRQTALLANKLLRVAYGDKFELSFELTDNDFFIRVTDNEGNVRDDARSLSDGEKSVVGLSLSLALIEQTGNRDKILYLDEADGVLDSNNRRSFINILENQLVLLGIEQCFIISHNDSFKDAVADVILLRDDDEDPDHLQTKAAFLENKNVIFDYKDL